ncbi:hypothetical protein FOXYSP1_10210 [Fusarium oxysporum f. sp. phaseoli]
MPAALDWQSLVARSFCSYGLTIS